MNRTRQAGMYSLLAELLAEPQAMMNDSGKDWSLFVLLTEFAAESQVARKYLDLIAAIPCENLDQRRERYAALFSSGRPGFWLYEAAAKTGKILGSFTFEMAQLYHAFGLEVVGAELPDHISLELKFLSQLVEQIDDLSYEVQFLKKHGDWMIELGHNLRNSDDPVYAPIGALLADWLIEQTNSVTSDQPKAIVTQFTPILPKPDDCTLCGFCAQICPTQALKVMEYSDFDLLSFNPEECINCGKCERICEFQALKMSLPLVANNEIVILHQSPHVNCQACGEGIASQAEMDYLVSKIGEATWQNFCLDCRTRLYI